MRAAAASQRSVSTAASVRPSTMVNNDAFIITILNLDTHCFMHKIMNAITQLAGLCAVSLVAVAENPMPREIRDAITNISDYADINMVMAVQLLMDKKDSKEFIDRPSKRPFCEVKDAFCKIEKAIGLEKNMEVTEAAHRCAFTHNLFVILGGRENIASISDLGSVYRSERAQKHTQVLRDFVEAHFLSAGADIETHMPVDYSDSPEFIKSLSSPRVIEIAKALNSMWPVLSRKAVQFANGEVSSLLRPNYPFFVPGGRFREFYYWDTYWILRGLKVCNMYESATNVIRNFIDMIREFGYIPNGSRKYYQYRTQPPYFAMMLMELYNCNGGRHNELVLGEGLEMATSEYEFFDAHRHILLTDESGETHKVGVYDVDTDFPRLESFGEDIITAISSNDLEGARTYSNIKSVAESGWDFSSRWLADPTDLKTMYTIKRQVPADLNALLYKNEVILGMLWSDRGDAERANDFRARAARRAKAINTLLWSRSEGTWMDLNLDTNKHVSGRFYFSNIEPMVYGVPVPEGWSAYDLLHKYHMELFGYPGGVPASGGNDATGHQWDFPNVWAPHQQMLVEFLMELGEREMALHAGRAFFKSVTEGYVRYKAFCEKYNCVFPGITGNGGEYKSQVGFGWTNGVSLKFIQDFGDEIEWSDISHEKSYQKIKTLLDRRVGASAAVLSIEGVPEHVPERVPEHVAGVFLLEV